MNSLKSSAPNSPWFGVSMALIGVIVGYGLASATGGAMPSGQYAQVPAAPAPAAPAAPTPSAPPAAPDATNVPKVTAADYVRGDKNATISIIEYSDFECPFCKRHHPTLQAAVKDIPDVNWVYRHYPLDFHANAMPAALASECAGEQGKFWEMADMIVEKGTSNFSTYAADLKLNTGKFDTCVSSKKYEQKIKDQMAAGSAAGVSGTPGNIILNNKTGKAKLVSGAQGIDAFKAAVESLK